MAKNAHADTLRRRAYVETFGSLKPVGDYIDVGDDWLWDIDDSFEILSDKIIKEHMLQIYIPVYSGLF